MSRAKKQEEHLEQKSNNSLKIKLEHLNVFDPLTENQKKFYDLYKKDNPLTILHGTAGTGKTFIALYKAIEQVLDKGNPYTKVVIIRSAVQGREVGHLPGDLREKLDAYTLPYQQICTTLFDRKDAFKRLEEQGYIEFVCTSFIRGMSFDDSIIIVDEMQNMNFEELSTVITRIGSRTKVIFCGDYRQVDLRRSFDQSGLLKFLEIVKLMPSCYKLEFNADDIVRSSIVKEWIIAELRHKDLEEQVKEYKNVSIKK